MAASVSPNLNHLITQDWPMAIHPASSWASSLYQEIRSSFELVVLRYLLEKPYIPIYNDMKSRVSFSGCRSQHTWQRCYCHFQLPIRTNLACHQVRFCLPSALWTAKAIFPANNPCGKKERIQSFTCRNAQLSEVRHHRQRAIFGTAFSAVRMMRLDTKTSPMAPESGPASVTLTLQLRHLATVKVSCCANLWVWVKPLSRQNVDAYINIIIYIYQIKHI